MADDHVPPAAGVPPADTSGFKSFFALIKKRAFEAVVVALITGFSTGLWLSWTNLKTWTKERGQRFVIETVVAELNKNENRLLDPVKTTLTKIRSTEIGALSVGNFVLTPNNPQYILPVYLPLDHAGQLSVMLSGNVIPNKSYVVLMLPNGKKVDFSNAETTINLTKLLQMGGIDGSDFSDNVVVRPDYIKGLRTLTFQLTGQDASARAASPGSSDDAGRAVYVRYLALVSPTINMRAAQ